MAKKQSKSSAKSPVSKVTRQLSVFASTRGKLALFIIAFALLGGGALLVQTLAASVPPESLTAHRQFTNVKASDGYVGTVQCLSTAKNTPFGQAARCEQIKPNSQTGDYEARIGEYNFVTKQFYPAQRWSKPVEWTQPVYHACKNMDNQHRSTLSTFNTPFGPARYGQIYRYSGGQWQMKYAHRNLITGECFPTDTNWTKAIAF